MASQRMLPVPFSLIATKNGAVGYFEIDDNHKKFLVRPGETTVGRGTGCGVVLNHDSVALHHATVECDGPPEAVFVYDKDTMRGSKLWQCKMKPYVRYHLQNNSQIFFGDVQVTYHACINGPLLYEPPISAEVGSSNSETPRRVNRKSVIKSVVFNDTAVSSPSCVFRASAVPAAMSPSAATNPEPATLNDSFFDQATQLPLMLTSSDSPNIFNEMTQLPSVTLPLSARLSNLPQSHSASFSDEATEHGPSSPSVFMQATQLPQVNGSLSPGSMESPTSCTSAVNKSPSVFLPATQLPCTSRLVPDKPEQFRSGLIASPGVFLQSTQMPFCEQSNTNIKTATSTGSMSLNEKSVMSKTGAVNALNRDSRSPFSRESLLDDGEDDLFQNLSSPNPGVSANSTAENNILPLQNPQLSCMSYVSTSPLRRGERDHSDSDDDVIVSSQSSQNQRRSESQLNNLNETIIPESQIQSLSMTDGRVVESSDSEATECYDVNHTVSSQTNLELIGETIDDGDRTDSDIEGEDISPLANVNQELENFSEANIMKSLVAENSEDSENLLLCDSDEADEIFNVAEPVQSPISSRLQRSHETISKDTDTQVLTQSPPRNFQSRAASSWMMSGAAEEVTMPLSTSSRDHFNLPASRIDSGLPLDGDTNLFEKERIEDGGKQNKQSISCNLDTQVLTQSPPDNFQERATSPWMRTGAAHLQQSSATKQHSNGRASRKECTDLSQDAYEAATQIDDVNLPVAQEVTVGNELTQNQTTRGSSISGPEPWDYGTQVLTLSPPDGFQRPVTSPWMRLGAANSTSRGHRDDGADDSRTLDQVDQGVNCDIPETQVLTQSPPIDVIARASSPSDDWMKSGADTLSQFRPPQTSNVSQSFSAGSVFPSASTMDLVDPDISLTQLTQPTQAFEQLSLEMPGTQDFHEQMVTEAFQTVWSESDNDDNAHETVEGDSRKKNVPAVRLKRLTDSEVEKANSSNISRPTRSRKPTWKVLENSNNGGKMANASKSNSGDETESDVDEAVDSLPPSSFTSAETIKAKRSSNSVARGPIQKRRKSATPTSDLSDRSRSSDVGHSKLLNKTGGYPKRNMSRVICSDSETEALSEVEESLVPAESARKCTNVVLENKENDMRVSTGDFLTDTEEIRFTGVATRTRASTVLSIPLRKGKVSELKVAFTGGVRQAHRHAVIELGGQVTEVDVADVLVCDKVRRTIKLLEAIALGIPVVPSKWLTTSKKAGCWIEAKFHILRDLEAEKRWNFNLPESIKKAEVSQFMRDYVVTASPNIKPPPNEVYRICELSGATCLRVSPRTWPSNCLYISCPADKSSWPKNVKVLDVEVILCGVLQQKLDLESHMLRN